MSKAINGVTVATDLVISKGKKFLFIIRRDDLFPGHIALPGGVVELDETVEDAAVRELEEETGVKIKPSNFELVGVFSEPKRDPRGRVISVAYSASVPEGTEAIAGDDAKETIWLTFEEAMERSFAFDHEIIFKTAHWQQEFINHA